MLFWRLSIFFSGNGVIFDVMEGCGFDRDTIEYSQYDHCEIMDDDMVSLFDLFACFDIIDLCIYFLGL